MHMYTLNNWYWYWYWYTIPRPSYYCTLCLLLTTLIQQKLQAQQWPTCKPLTTNQTNGTQRQPPSPPHQKCSDSTVSTIRPGSSLSTWLSDQPDVSYTIRPSGQPTVVSTWHVTHGWKLVCLSRLAVLHFTGRQRQWWVGCPDIWTCIVAILSCAAPNHTKEQQWANHRKHLQNQTNKHPHHNKRLTQTTQPTLQEFWTGEEREEYSLNLTRKRTSKRQANSEDVS